MFTNSKCEEFAVHFRDKIDTTRSNLCQSQTMNLNTTEPLFLWEETLEKFVLIDGDKFGKVISQLKSATWLLDPIPTSFF